MFTTSLANELGAPRVVARYGVGASLLFAATGLEPGSLPVDRLQVRRFDVALFSGGNRHGDVKRDGNHGKTWGKSWEYHGKTEDTQERWMVYNGKSPI